MSISVIIPTYNRAEQLGAVLPSYQASPLVKEIIIVDDGSSDNTALWVSEWTKSDSRLRYVRNSRNMGLPASRNRGASLASADWVLESEDDLLLDEHCVETLIAHGQQHEADIIAPRRIWMRLGETPEAALERGNRAPGRLLNEWLMDHSTQALTTDDVETSLLGATMLIRRTLFDVIQYDAFFGTSSSWREESDFQLRAAEHGYKLVFCPHAVTFHYSRASQSFGRNRIKGTAVYAYRVYRNNLAFLRRHRPYLRAHYPKSLLLGSPELSALLYGGYRAAWLLAAEVLRFIRSRRYGGFSWK